MTTETTIKPDTAALIEWLRSLSVTAGTTLYRINASAAADELERLQTIASTLDKVNDALIPWQLKHPGVSTTYAVPAMLLEMEKLQAANSEFAAELAQLQAQLEQTQAVNGEMLSELERRPIKHHLADCLERVREAHCRISNGTYPVPIGGRWQLVSHEKIEFDQLGKRRIATDAELAARLEQPAPTNEGELTRCPACGQGPPPEVAKKLMVLTEELKATKTVTPADEGEPDAPQKDANDEDPGRCRVSNGVVDLQHGSDGYWMGIKTSKGRSSFIHIASNFIGFAQSVWLEWAADQFIDSGPKQPTEAFRAAADIEAATPISTSVHPELGSLRRAWKANDEPDSLARVICSLDKLHARIDAKPMPPEVREWCEEYDRRPTTWGPFAAALRADFRARYGK